MPHVQLYSRYRREWVKNHREARRAFYKPPRRHCSASIARDALYSVERAAVNIGRGEHRSLSYRGARGLPELAHDTRRSVSTLYTKGDAFVSIWIALYPFYMASEQFAAVTLLVGLSSRLFAFRCMNRFFFFFFNCGLFLCLQGNGKFRMGACIWLFEKLRKRYSYIHWLIEPTVTDRGTVIMKSSTRGGWIYTYRWEREEIERLAHWGYRNWTSSRLSFDYSKQDDAHGKMFS